MRIGIVLAKVPGYSETFFNSKIKGLIERGIDIQLFVNKADHVFEICEVREAPRVYRNGVALGFSFLGTFFNLLPHINAVFNFWKLESQAGKSSLETIKSIYLNAHILSARLDWLHFGFATMALDRENLARAIGAKMAVSLRGYDINLYPLKQPGCYKMLWERVDKVHTISNYLRIQALKLGLKQETPFQVIPPAVDLATLPERVMKQPTRSNLQIVTVARLHWIKGLDTAMNAIKLLNDKGINIDYTIIGNGPKKDCERYAFLALSLGIKDRVHFAGKLSHSATLQKMAACDIYLQPSLNEGFCNAVLEAQALGVPVVASRVGGLPENIEEGRSGWLFEPLNQSELEKLVATIMNLPQTKRATISEFAVKRVRESFNLERQKESFIKFYR